MAKAAKQQPKASSPVGTQSHDELNQLDYAKIHIAAGLGAYSHYSPAQIADRAHKIAIEILTKPATDTDEEE